MIYNFILLTQGKLQLSLKGNAKRIYYNDRVCYTFADIIIYEGTTDDKNALLELAGLLDIETEAEKYHLTYYTQDLKVMESLGNLNVNCVISVQPQTEAVLKLLEQL